MALLILVGLAVAPILWILGWIPWMAALVIELAVLFIAAWGIDRHRRPGAREPFIDAHRADVAGGHVADVALPPAEAFQSPTDRGAPS